MSKVANGKKIDKKGGQYGIVDGTITTKVVNAEDVKEDVQLEPTKQVEEVPSTCNSTNLLSLLVIFCSLLIIAILARIMIPPEEEEAAPVEIALGVTHYEYHYTRQDDYNNDWYTPTDYDF